MQQPTVLLVLCLAVACCPLGALSSLECTAPGALTCDETCGNVVVCLGDGEGGFREESVETCDAEKEQYCYALSRSCESRNSCDGLEAYPFECTNVGQFPNPIDCQTFYVCAPATAPETGFVKHLSSCEAGYAYNSSRGFCNLPLDHPTCVNGPVPACTEVGAVGALPENTSIYFVCKRRQGNLYPVLFVCKHGGAFNETTAACDAVRDSSDAIVLPR